MLFLPSRGSGEAQRKQHRNPDNTSAMPHPTFSGVGWGMALRQHCIGESDSPGPHRRGVSALDSVASTSQAYGLSSNDSSLDTSPAWELAGTAQNIHRQADDYRLSIYEAPIQEQALQLPHLHLPPILTQGHHHSHGILMSTHTGSLTLYGQSAHV